jgi:hypothetical protein
MSCAECDEVLETADGACAAFERGMHTKLLRHFEEDVRTLAIWYAASIQATANAAALQEMGVLLLQRAAMLRTEEAS